MEDMALTRFSIINVMEELCEKKDRVYSLEYTTDILMILLNMGEVTDTKQLFIDQIVNKTQQFFNDKFGILITFGIGNIYNGLEGIHKSYLQALECIEHQLIYGKNCIIDYEKLSTEKKLNFNYPLDMEVQLINSIKLGKYKESCEILNQLYKINFSEGIMSINMTRCLFFDIMSTVIKVLKELETYQEKSIISGTIQIEQLLSCRNVDEMWLMAKQIIGDICTFINNQDEDHLLFTKISEFIDKQLTNANLNVTMIADAFQITSSYLSVFFKSHGHDTLKSYINKRRVELAKELLKDEYTLIEIAEKIGYSNDIVLIRNFKRFENMTPSEYRSLFKRE